MSVALTDEGGVGPTDGGGTSTGEAVDDALGTLLGALNLFVRALGVAVPVALGAGVAGLAVATVRRRRREGALSGRRRSRGPCRTGDLAVPECARHGTVLREEGAAWRASTASLR